MYKSCGSTSRESAGERRDDEALEGEEGHLDIWEPPGVEEGDGVDTSGKQFILNCQVVVCMRVCVCVQGDIQAQMLGERRGTVFCNVSYHVLRLLVVTRILPFLLTLCLMSFSKLLWFPFWFPV